MVVVVVGEGIHRVCTRVLVFIICLKEGGVKLFPTVLLRLIYSVLATDAERSKAQTIFHKARMQAKQAYVIFITFDNFYDHL